MSRMEFFIVDVFTVGRKYTGNQLAVYLGNPPAPLMQQLAKEINFSETTFVTSDAPEGGGYNVRIFMPEVEVDFAGHPVLGTAYVIQQELIGHPVDSLNLNLAVGQIPVTFGADGLLWMRQNPPIFGHRFSAGELAQILNVSEEDIDARYPIQEVSTGMAFVLVPMASLDAVKRAWVNLDRLRAILGAHDAIAPAIFCAETLNAENDIHVRVLDDIYGAPEDPATAAPMAASRRIWLSTVGLARTALRFARNKGIRLGVPRCCICGRRASTERSSFVLAAAWRWWRRVSWPPIRGSQGLNRTLAKGNEMDYRMLGRTGVKVSSLCFGTMSFGDIADEAESGCMFSRCRELGVNFFDCANVYAGGRSEEILGDLIAGCRDEIVLDDQGGVAHWRLTSIREAPPAGTSRSP